MVTALPGGVTGIDCETVPERHGLQHAEHTLVSADGICVAHSEGDGISHFRAEGHGRYVPDGPPGADRRPKSPPATRSGH